MHPIPRILEKQIARAARSFPAIVLTGPRRVGKTFLLRHLFPKAQYFLFEDPDVVSRFRSDPQGFLDGVTPPVIFDEIQNVPEVFNYVRTRIDRAPRQVGRWFLTGSQESSLMKGVTESMTGRAAVLQLLPMSLAESPRVSFLLGGFPEVMARPRAAQLWFSSYLQTYLERDVRAAANVSDVALFRRFLSLVAARHGQILNRSDIAAPLGISVPTVSRWLDLLEATGQVAIVPPYFENFGKRVVKSPKVYITDSGLACHLLGIETTTELEKSPFLGALFEGFLAGEILKHQVNQGRRRELYYFRDQQGLEVDFIVPGKKETWFIEAKASHSPMPAMATGINRLRIAASSSHGNNRGFGKVSAAVVYRPAKVATGSSALVPGVAALSIPEFLSRYE
jgi:uncharacterized protein